MICLSMDFWNCIARRLGKHDQGAQDTFIAISIILDEKVLLT